MQEVDRVKEERRRRHTRAGESKRKAERKEVVRGTELTTVLSMRCYFPSYPHDSISQVVDDLCSVLLRQ